MHEETKIPGNAHRITHQKRIVHERKMNGAYWHGLHQGQYCPPHRLETRFGPRD
ncbi:MAG: DUF1925 domain-containing protein [Nitrospirales bacterium]|nr:DUF1925 domain-containing protein [Nitrospirales bacterium]